MPDERGNSKLWAYIRERYEADVARMRASQLLDEVSRFSDADLRQSCRYADLVKNLLIIGDVERAREFAVRCETCRIGGSEGWFWYAMYFADRNIIYGAQVSLGCSTIEEVIFSLERVGGAFGNNELGEFFEKRGNIPKAIEYYLKAVKHPRENQFVVLAKQHLSELLMK